MEHPSLSHLPFSLSLPSFCGNTLELRAKHVNTQPIPAQCPNCDALNEIPHGKKYEKCSHCDSSFVPNQETQDKAQNAAQHVKEKVTLEQLQKERQIAFANKSSEYSTLILLSIFVVIPLLIASCAFTILAITSSPPPSAIKWILTLWFSTLCFLAGFVLAFVLKKKSKETWQQSITDLAKNMANGQSFEGPEKFVSWLNQFWPIRYDCAYLIVGLRFCGVSFTIHGQPALFVFDVIRESEEIGTYPKIHLLVALSLFSPSEKILDTTFFKEINKISLKAGFALEWTKIGLLAKANTAFIDKVKKKPQFMNSHLLPALEELSKVIQIVKREYLTKH